MITLDTNILSQVVTRAEQSAVAHPRWINAIRRAAVELESNPYIEALDDHTLLIGSPSGNTYVSNGVCGCVAYANQQPCWHRSAARLYRRYVETEQRKAAAAHALAQINELF